MRLGIIEFDSPKTGVDLFAVGELAATVGRDVLMRQIFQQVDDGPVDAVGGLAFRFAAQEKAALSADQSDTTGFSSCAAHGKCRENTPRRPETFRLSRGVFVERYSCFVLTPAP